MTERCETCGGVLVDRLVTRDAPYAYTLSGLKGVRLMGIHVRRCEHCDSETPIIPRIGELHQLIATELTRKPTLLRGDEIRFLRKHAGLAAMTFAHLIGVSPEHLSRIENGHRDSLGESSDRLARVCVLAIAKDGEAAREILTQIAGQYADQTKIRKPPAKAGKPVFSLEKHKGWRRVAA